MSDYEQSYLGQLRKVAGNRRLITPGIRAVIFDDDGRVLLIQRSDNGTWAMPGGSMELGQSVFDTLVREVKEETGVDVVSAELISIYSNPRFHFTNAYGGKHQMLSFVFHVTEWSGSLTTKTNETTNAGFFPLNELPPLNAVYLETLEDIQNFSGTVIVK